MKKRIIIGLAGKRRAGKDTVCQCLQTALADLYAVRLAFADAMKYEVAHACGVHVSDIERDKEAYRPMLQWWGTEFRRKLCGNDNYWVDKVEDCLDEMVLPRVVIITDVRYMNEIKMIRSHGGEIWNIIRPIERGQNDSHSSETSLDLYGGFDKVIINADSFTRLQEELINNIVPEIRKKLQ